MRGEEKRREHERRGEDEKRREENRRGEERMRRGEERRGEKRTECLRCSGASDDIKMSRCSKKINTNLRANLQLHTDAHKFMSVGNIIESVCVCVCV